LNLGTTFRKEASSSDDAIIVNASRISYEFVDVYDFKLLAGRNFSEDAPSDLDSAVLINETGTRMLGFESPEAALGEKLVIGRSTEIQVIGVLKDFDWMSAKQARSPILFLLQRDGSLFSVKLAAADMGDTIARIQGVFTSLFPGNAFEYFFTEDSFNELYHAEERLQALVALFAGLALLVAALGLIGLAALTTAQRFKEISIRKVLGAGDLAIARLLTTQFSVLVLAGVALSVPAVYVVANDWLDGFASRIRITPDAFLLPGLAVLVAALVSSGYHILRASRSNPVDGIRGE